MKIKYIIGFLIVMALSGFVVKAQDLPVRPEPPRLVNDFAGVLAPEQVNSLENKLVNFNRRTSTQIAIVTVKSLSGYDKADYSFKLAEKWGIGQKGKNNGILILVKPKYGNEKGEVFVAVGYGLEAVVPDAVSRQALVSEELIPAFKQNDYFKGLDRSTDVLISLTSGEFTAEKYIESTGKRKSGSSGGGFVTILIVMILFFVLKRGSSNHHSIGGGTPGFLGGLLLGNMLGGNRHHGSWNDFSGGSGFGGGSSGSDFGGFGGGSFGGGGAGGSW
ncbi:MAG: TPM domain-containing protein [Mariniphaga sp.]